MSRNSLTAGQTRFLKAVAEGQPGSFHVRVTAPVMDAGFVFAKPGALFPFIAGCNGQNASDYYLTDAGAQYLTDMQATA